MLEVRHLDPRVLASSEPGLDTHDRGYLNLHGPSRTLSGFLEVIIAAGASKIDNGLGCLGEGFEEVVRTVRLCRGWRHMVRLLRVWT